MLTINLVVNDFRDQPFSQELLPAFITHIKSKYPKAHLSVQVHPAADWLQPDSPTVNPDWHTILFASPSDAYKEAEIKENLDESLAELGAKISLPYILPPH